MPPLRWGYQANVNELTTQIGQVLLAGAKGLTLFQTQHSFFQSLHTKTSPVGDLLRSIAFLRETLRVGDIHGSVHFVGAVFFSQHVTISPATRIALFFNVVVVSKNCPHCV